jgi:predicted DNA-binding protein (MmcQ/YjbR family)
VSKLDRVKSETEHALVERLRALTADMPQVSEHVDGFGHLSFRAGKKPFVMMGSSELHLAIKADPFNQAELIKTGRFTRTPYIGQHGWVSAADPENLDWEEIGELVEDAYRGVASKTMLKQLAIE